MRGFLASQYTTASLFKGYGAISKSHAKLLKKNSFHWTIEAQEAFNKLKKLMIEVLVLAMLDYFKPFVVEVDACD